MKWKLLYYKMAINFIWSRIWPKLISVRAGIKCYSSSQCANIAFIRSGTHRLDPAWGFPVNSLHFLGNGKKVREGIIWPWIITMGLLMRIVVFPISKLGRIELLHRKSKICIISCHYILHSLLEYWKYIYENTILCLPCWKRVMCPTHSISKQVLATWNGNANFTLFITKDSQTLIWGEKNQTEFISWTK